MNDQRKPAGASRGPDPQPSEDEPAPRAQRVNRVVIRPRPEDAEPSGDEASVLDTIEEFVGRPASLDTQPAPAVVDTKPVKVPVAQPKGSAYSTNQPVPVPASHRPREEGAPAVMIRASMIDDVELYGESAPSVEVWTPGGGRGPASRPEPSLRLDVWTPGTTNVPSVGQAGRSALAMSQGGPPRRLSPPRGLLLERSSAQAGSEPPPQAAAVARAAATVPPSGFGRALNTPTVEIPVTRKRHNEKRVAAIAVAALVAAVLALAAFLLLRRGRPHEELPTPVAAPRNR